jgi:uncharacterized protein YkwD
MIHKPIALMMILPIFVAGILMLGLLAATARGQDDNAGGGETQAPPSTEAAPPAAPPSTETTPTSGCGPGTDNSTCSATPTPTPTPTSGCGPGTDNSTCSATPTPTPTPTPGNATASQQSNNTGNTQASNNTNAYVNVQPDAKIILDIHNRERAAVGVPPLVWSDKLAAHAKTWADYLLTTGKFDHCGYTPGCETYGEGENLIQMQFFNPYKVHIPNPTELAQMVEQWVKEPRSAGHYNQMVSTSSKQVGCASASSGGPASQRDILVCRYTGSLS